MGRNNTLYKLYNNMFAMYKNNNKNIEREVYCLMMFYGDNIEFPFPANSKENSCLDTMFVCFTKWRNGGPEAKFNYRKTIDAAKELCNLNPVNPYSFDKEEEKRDVAEQKEKERQQKLEEQRLAEERRIAEEQKHLEEQKRIEEEKKIEEQKKAEEELKQKEIKEVKLEEPEHILGVIPEDEQEKEKKSWLQFLFPWKKEGESK